MSGAAAAPIKRRRRGKALPEETQKADQHYEAAEAERCARVCGERNNARGSTTRLSLTPVPPCTHTHAHSYTTQNAQIQVDLTLSCAALLGLDAVPPPPGRLVVDAGCGSALSSRALAAPPLRCGVIGFDVARDMLACATSSSTADACVLADAGACWPVRRGAADAVVSVSVAQWLLVAPHPTAALDAFFDSLVSCLKPGAGAVAQVYARSDGETTALASAARRAGAAATLLVDVPHAAGGARKTFLAMVAPPGCDADRAAFAAAAAGPAHDCPCAWPRADTACALWWRSAVTPALASTASLPTTAHSRLRDEHERSALRLARVVRRARGDDGGARGSARLEAWLPAPTANACGVPVLISVMCEPGGGVDGAQLATALGCDGDVKEGAAPRAAPPGPPGGHAPTMAVLPTGDPDIGKLVAPGVARFLVATLEAGAGGDAAGVIAVAATAAVAVAAAARVGLYLITADVLADGRVTVTAAWHARNAVASAADVADAAARVGEAMREERGKIIALK